MTGMRRNHLGKMRSGWCGTAASTRGPRLAARHAGLTNRAGRVSLALLLTVVSTAVGVLVPFFAAYEAARRWGVSRQAVADAEDRDELTQVLAATMRATEPETRCDELGRRLVAGWRWGGPLPPDLLHLPAGAAQLLLRDPTGKVHSVRGFPVSGKVAAARYFALLNKLHGDQSYRLSTGERSLAATLLGRPGTAGMLARYPNRFLDLRDSGVHRLAGWYHLPTRDQRSNTSYFYRAPRQRKSRSDTSLLAAPGWQLLFIIDLDRIDVARLRDDTVQRQQRLCRGLIHLGTIDLKTGVLPPTTASLPADVVRQLMRTDSPPAARIGNHHLALADDNSGTRYFASKPCTDAGGWWQRVAGHIRTAGLLLCVLALVATAYGRGSSISIRLQLTLLFLVAGLVGGTGLIGFGLLYSQSREEALTTRATRDAFAMLAKIDDAFRPSLAPLHEWYRAEVTTAERLANVPASLQAAIERRPRAQYCYAVLLDPAGQPRWEVRRPGLAHLEGWDRYFAKIAVAFGRRILQLSGFPVAVNPGGDPVLTSYFSHPNFSTNVMRHLGTLQTLNLMGERATFFFQPVRDQVGTTTGLLAILHDSVRLESDYIQHLQHRLRRASGQRLVALPKARLPLLGPFPRSVLDHEPVRQIHERLLFDDSPTTLRATMGGRPALLVGIPGSNLRDYHLCLITDLGRLERDRTTWIRAFRMLTVLTIAFLLLLARQLSENLLEPIRAIGSGIDHLTAMRWRERIDVAANDELGDISTGVNTILAEMHELHSAREVQHHLLPEASLTVERCRGFGRHCFNRAVTGSFFLTLRGPETTLLLIGGRARGDGVLAGLLSAMAMAAFRLQADGLATPDPVQLLQRVLAFFPTLLARPLALEATLVVCDAKRELLQVAGTGGGALLMFPAQGTPLRVLIADLPRSSSGFSCGTVPFAPGTMVVVTPAELAMAAVPAAPPSDLALEQRGEAVIDALAREHAEVFAREDLVFAIGVHDEPTTLPSSCSAPESRP